MWRKEFAYQLRVELNIARAEYLEAKRAFLEALDELRLVNRSDAGVILELAVQELNRTFELHREAAERCATFERRGDVPVGVRAA